MTNWQAAELRARPNVAPPGASDVGMRATECRSGLASGLLSSCLSMRLSLLLFALLAAPTAFGQSSLDFAFGTAQLSSLTIGPDDCEGGRGGVTLSYTAAVPVGQP